MIITNEQYERSTIWRTKIGSKYDHLTKRGRTILLYLLKAKSDKINAKELGIGVKTVETYVSIIFSTFGLTPRNQIVYWVYKNLPDYFDFLN